MRLVLQGQIEQLAYLRLGLRPLLLLLPPAVGIVLNVARLAFLFGEPKFDYGEWQELPLRPEVATHVSQATDTVLSPTQEMTILSVDLRDYFDTKRLGSYLAKVLFQVPGQAEEQSNEIIFSVAEPVQ